MTHDCSPSPTRLSKPSPTAKLFVVVVVPGYSSFNSAKLDDIIIVFLVYY
jgi:hypothetical protein